MVLRYSLYSTSYLESDFFKTMPQLEVYTGFNPDTITEYFVGRGWPVRTMPSQVVNLVKVTRGAALECGDGRFDQLEERKAHGVRVFGGINAIMAIHTGGNEVGLQRATELIQMFGANPGTHSADHGGCGFAELWIAGELKSAIYPYRLEEEIERGGGRVGQWLVDRMRSLGGKHFRLNGNHYEEGIRLNPFRGYTEAAIDGLRFRVDDWFLAGLGVPDKVRFFKIAEAVEKLKPDAARLEIIIP